MQGYDITQWIGQLTLTKEGITQSWKLITGARFIILLLCVWTGAHVYLCCGHVSMLICEQSLSVSQCGPLALFSGLQPSIFDYWTGDNDIVCH